MITQREASKFALKTGIGDKVIEKDYVLTWILLALADNKISKALVFKGGTALKKRQNLRDIIQAVPYLDDVLRELKRNLKKHLDL